MKQHDVKEPQAAPVKKPSVFQGLQLFLVQSSVCVIVLAIALLLRVIGGDVFSDLAARFREAMLDDTLVSAVSASLQWDQVQASETKAAVNTAYYPPLTGGVITSAFGEREDPTDPSQTDDHEGVDIGAAEGTSIAALADGTVTVVSFEKDGYGHYLVIECNDKERYLYAHCSSIAVAVGDTVTAGETVAFVGSTGRTTGSHLHVEWLENSRPVDPMTVLPEQTFA